MEETSQAVEGLLKFPIVTVIIELLTEIVPSFKITELLLIAQEATVTEVVTPTALFKV